MSTNAKDMPIVKLESPRFEDSRPLLIAGLAGRYTASTLDDLPALWKHKDSLNPIVALCSPDSLNISVQWRIAAPVLSFVILHFPQILDGVDPAERYCKTERAGTTGF
jgi:hypothetical protein